MVARNEGKQLYEGLREAMTEHFTNKTNMYSVSETGVLLFRNEMAQCDDVRDRLCSTMLGLGQTEREGESVDRASLKKTCEMLVVLGLDLISIYEEDLEYIAQVEQRINEESERVKQCLDNSTVVAVVQVVQKELIGKHMKAAVDMEDSGVEHMLRNQFVPRE
ncbi:hypothetical protein MTO96_031031 [Rhipicephalus appendiculatus]